MKLYAQITVLALSVVLVTSGAADKAETTTTATGVITVSGSAGSLAE